MSFNQVKDLNLRKFLINNFKVGTPSDSVAASLTLGMGDQQIVFTALDSGVVGNTISVSILDSGEDNSSLSFSFDIISKHLIIYPQKTSGSIISTCSDIADALNAHATVSSYLSTTGGIGTIEVQDETNLSGGSNGTEGLGKCTEYINGDIIYFCFNDADYSSTGKWRKHGSSSEIGYDEILDYGEILDYDDILDW